jgi:hypothetical protein
MSYPEHIDPAQDKLFVSTLTEIVLEHHDWDIDQVTDELRRNGWSDAYVSFHLRAIAEAIYKRDLLRLDGRI